MFALTAVVLVLLALAPLAYLALAPPLEQLPARLTELPGGRVEYLQDRDGAHRLDAIAAGSAGEVFHPIANVQKDIALLRVPGHRVNWLRLTVPNDEPKPARVVLQFANRDLEAAEIFARGSSGTVAAEPIARTGLRLLPPERTFRSHLPAFSVTIPPHETAVLFVRNPSETNLPPQTVLFWPSDGEFRGYEQREVLAIVMFVALCGALFLFHTLTGVVLRERIVPLFLLYLLAASALVLFASNVGGWFLPVQAGVRHHAVVLGLLGVASFVRIQFSRALLDLRRLPRLDASLRTTGWLVGVATLLAPALLIAPEVLPLAARIVSGAVLFTVIAVPLVASSAGLRGVRQAPLAALAFGCTAAAVAWIILGRFGVVAAAPVEWLALVIGGALEVLLLAATITHRQQLFREEQDASSAAQASRLEREAADAKGDLLGLAHQLAHSKKEKDRLVGILAHDVRAPLASLLAASRALSPDRAAEQLPLIRRRCTALIELLGNALDWARLRMGQFPHEPRPMILSAASEIALRPLEIAAAEKGVRLERRIPANLITRADETAVQCVLRHLVGNAVKFTPTGGTVAVEAGVVGPHIELRVQDNGMGMTPDQLARVQPSGTPADVPTTPGTAGETGAGVGISVVRELLDRDGATLRFESTLGRGSTAIVTLPGHATPVPGAVSRTPEPERRAVTTAAH